MEKVNALLVDDSKLVCESMTLLLDSSPHIKKTYWALATEEAEKILKQENIRVLVADARIPGSDTMGFIRKAKKEYSSLRIIGITAYAEANTLYDLYHAGVHAILKKTSTDFAEINMCLTEVLAGRHYWPDELPPLLTEVRMGKPLELTARDLDILSLLCQGMATKKIANELGLQMSSIEDHRKRLLQKTGTKNSSELIAFVHRNGLL